MEELQRKKEGREAGKKRCQDTYVAYGDSLGTSAQLCAIGFLQHCIIYEFQDQLLFEHNHTLALNTWTTHSNHKNFFFSHEYSDLSI